MKDEPLELYALVERLRGLRWVDLSHPFRPGIPRYPDDEDEQRRDGMRCEETGFWTVVHTLVGAWGTHMDAPAHMFPGGRSVDAIEARELVLPLVVLDISERVVTDPDAVVRLADVEAWERRHGPMPEGAFVALRTDWWRRWPDAEAMANLDDRGMPHTPGWSLEVLRFLYEARGACAHGHETLDPDPGSSTGRPIPDDRPLPEVMHAWYACEAYTLRHDHYQIEALCRLDEVPEAGALVWIGVPPAAGCPNFPVRVWAVCP